MNVSGKKGAGDNSSLMQQTTSLKEGVILAAAELLLSKGGRSFHQKSRKNVGYVYMAKIGDGAC